MPPVAEPAPEPEPEFDQAACDAAVDAAAVAEDAYVNAGTEDAAEMERLAAEADAASQAATEACD